MLGRIILIGVGIAAIAAGLVLGPKFLASGPDANDAQPSTDARTADDVPVSQTVKIGDDLYKVQAPQLPAPPRRQGLVLNPVQINDCQVIAPEKEEVPATKDGFIAFIGTELKLTVALAMILIVLTFRPSGLFGRAAVQRV